MCLKGSAHSERETSRPAAGSIALPLPYIFSCDG
jgi:hypothetical protein